MNLICDMHMHSQSSHDSVATVAQMAEACVKKGVYAFAITDHCDIQYYKECNAAGIVESSLSEVEAQKKSFEGKVKILKGIEIGEAIWEKAYADEILAKFDYDVIISSVHAVRYDGYTEPYSTIDFSKMTDMQIDEYLQAYFDDVYQMVSEVDFDIMAHLTCPLRYIVGKHHRCVDITKYEGKIRKILDYVVKNSISMEINTSGIGGFYSSLMPDEWIIKMFFEMGGRLITLGSDAHAPSGIANAFEQTASFLKSVGFEGYYYYEKRKRIFCEL